MMPRLILCALTGCAILVFANLNAAKVRDPRDAERSFITALSGVWEQIRDPDPAVRGRVKQRLSDLRSTLIIELVQMVESAPGDIARGSSEQIAVSLLGEWRATEACGLFVRRIELTSANARTSASRRLAVYPAAEALVEIGSPGADAITDWLLMTTTQASDRRLRLFGFVIWGVDGKDIGLARLRAALDEAMKRRTDERFRSIGDMPEKNLSRMIETFRTINFKDARQLPRL